jgi:type IV secretory pathway VirB2 component (pilin)
VTFTEILQNIINLITSTLGKSLLSVVIMVTGLAYMVDKVSKWKAISIGVGTVLVFGTAYVMQTILGVS